MNNINRQTNRRYRVRAKLLALSDLPRLVITRSNSHISGQLIDRTNGHTVCSFSSQTLKDFKGTKTAQATEVGTKLADLIKSKKITQVVLDRGHYRFHGRVKALAEAIKKSGINL